MIVKPGLRRNLGSTAQKSLQFQINNKNSTLVNRGTGANTYTCSTLRRVPDFEGILREVQINCPSFPGLRRVENLLTYSEDFSNAAWSKIAGGSGSIPVTTSNYSVAPDGTTTGTRVVFNRGAGSAGSDLSKLQHSDVTGLTTGYSVQNTLWVKSNDGKTYNMTLANGYSGGTAITITPTWQEFAYKSVAVAATTANFFLDLRGNVGTETIADISIWHPQLENVTGATNQNPSEYLSTMIYGAELITVQADREFSSDTGFWTGYPGGWTVSGGTINATNNSDYFLKTNWLPSTTGTYSVTYTVSSVSAGSVQLNICGVLGVARTTVGTYTEFITGAGANLHVGAKGTSFTGSIDNISVKQITGSTAQTAWKDYANPYTVDGNGVVTDSGVRTPLTLPAWYKGLLSEPAATNLLLQSHTLDITPWSINRATFTTGISSPTGDNSAYGINPTAINVPGIIQGVTIANAVVYTYSGFAKKGVDSYLHIQTDATAVLAEAWFDLNTGAVGTVTNCTGSIAPAANGWYRWSIQFTSAFAVSKNFAMYASSANNSQNATVTTNGIYLWGAQLETGTVATSYMPTTTGTTTRGATSDAYDKSNSKLGDITVYCEFTPNGTIPSVTQFFGNTAGTSASEQWNIFYTTGFMHFRTANGASLFDATFAVTLIAGTKYKVIGKLGTNVPSIFVNGVKGTDGTTLTGTQVTSTEPITVGGGTGYVNPPNSSFGQCRIYNTALSDAECIRMTT
jgi:hypothetical protein